MVTFDVGICAYNEEKNIKNVIESVLNQKLTRGHKLRKIFIVSSGSTDGTDNIVSSFSKKNKKIHFIMEKERKGKPSAFNKIIEKSKADVLINVAADIIPDSEAFENLLNEFDKDIGIVGGKPVVKEGKPYSESLWKIHNKLHELQSKKGILSHTSGEMFAMKKDTIRKIPEDVVNDDAFLALETFKKNYKIVFCENAIVHIKTPKNIIDFIKQRRRILWGHMQIKEYCKNIPDIFPVFFFNDPKNAISIYLQELKENPIGAVSCIFLEAMAWILAISDRIWNRNHILWKMAISTK